MANYQFVRKSDGLAVTLSDVDAQLCERAGVECSDVKYSRMYMTSILLGMAAAVKGQKVTTENLGEYADIYAHLSTAEFVQVLWLFTEYDFITWR